MVTADRIAAEYDTAGLRYEVDDDVGGLLRVPNPVGDVGEGDQAAEAVVEYVSPGCNGVRTPLHLLLRRLGCGFTAMVRSAWLTHTPDRNC